MKYRLVVLLLAAAACVAPRADAAAGTERQARLLLRQRGQFGKRVDAERGMRGEQDRLARNLHYFRERLKRIDRNLVDVRIAAQVATSTV